MALTLIAVVLALVLGHVVPSLLAVRRYDWFIAWLRSVGRMLAGGSVVQGRIGLLFDGHGYGLPLFCFSLLVLIYTWGPRDLDLDVEAVIDARDAEARRVAAK